MEKLKKELEICIKEKEEILNSFKRERANFLNYKKEEEERTKKTTGYFLEEIILELLPVLDNFEIAEKESSEKNKEWTEGFLKIKEQIKNLIKSLGAEEIDCLEKDFNPNFHEAVEVVQGEKSEVVIEEVQKGYLFRGKVIRPAKVKVSK